MFYPGKSIHWKTHAQASHTTTAAQQSRKRTISTPKEEHIGSLFIISSSSRAQPGYFMLDWRVRQYFISVLVHIPEEYSSLPRTTHWAKGPWAYHWWDIILCAKHWAETSFRRIRSFGWETDGVTLNFFLCHTDILFPRSKSATIWRWKLQGGDALWLFTERREEVRGCRRAERQWINDSVFPLRGIGSTGQAADGDSK